MSNEKETKNTQHSNEEKLSNTNNADMNEKDMNAQEGAENAAQTEDGDAKQLTVEEQLEEAKKQLAEIEALGLDKMPICMAKTQYSLSDDATKLGRPEGFRITVKELRISAGAGFIVALTGNILTMPGLPKKPAAENMDIDVNGKITGLF